MLGLLNQLSHHRLDDSNVSICPNVSQRSYNVQYHYRLTQEPAERSSSESDPEIG